MATSDKAFQKTLIPGAVLTGVHLVSRAMQRSARPGVILSIASAAVASLRRPTRPSTLQQVRYTSLRSLCRRLRNQGLRLRTVFLQLWWTRTWWRLRPEAADGSPRWQPADGRPS
jgi:hypothetical protein